MSNIADGRDTDALISTGISLGSLYVPMPLSMKSSPPLPSTAKLNPVFLFGITVVIVRAMLGSTVVTFCPESVLLLTCCSIPKSISV